MSLANPVNNLITQHLDTWTQAIETKSTAGRGSSNKLNLVGIQKLRELILEMAVRGLLVPQDPNDEPASVLLEKIATEKAQLIKDKKIKKTKSLPEITKEEKPFDLPNGWEWVRLGTVTEIVRGITFPASEKNTAPAKGLVACLRTANVQDSIEWDDLLYVPEKFVKRSDQFVEVDDIVMSMANSRELVGKVALVDKPLNFSVSFGGFLSVIRPFEIHPHFLMSVLRTPDFREEVIGSASQTTNIANISLAKLNPMVIACPPLEEQKRIVAKVDELMALCDQLESETLNHIDTHQTLVSTLLGNLVNPENTANFDQAWSLIAQNFDVLFTTDHSIDTLKQTILQLAVMGKLVPQNPNDEPASELLKKIATEKAQLIADKKIKKSKALPEISEDEKPFDLPKGWEWIRLGDIAVSVTSGSRGWAKYYSDSGALFLTMGNLSRNSFSLRLDNKRFVKPPENSEGERTKLQPFDILISITGDVGNLGLIPENLGDAYVNQHTCMLRLADDAKTLYIPNLLLSDFAKNQFNEPQRGIKNSFRLSDVSEIIVSLPPKEEQTRIVNKVNELMALCDQLKSQLQTAQTTQCHLAQSIAQEALG